MNRARPQDQSCQGRSTSRPTVAMSPRCARNGMGHRLCAMVLTGFVTLASTAGMSLAAESGGAGNSAFTSMKKTSVNPQSGPASTGIRDPLNPQAYMQDLAARMDPACDKKLLLRGVSAPKTTPASAGQTASKNLGPASPPRAVAVVPTAQSANAVPASLAKQGEPLPTAPGAPLESKNLTSGNTNSIAVPQVASPKSSVPTVPATGLFVAAGTRPSVQAQTTAPGGPPLTATPIAPLESNKPTATDAGSLAMPRVAPPKPPVPTVPAMGLSGGVGAEPSPQIPTLAPGRPPQTQDLELVKPGSNLADRMPLASQTTPAVPAPADRNEAYASAAAPALARPTVPIENRTLPAGKTQNGTNNLTAQGPVSVERQLALSRPGLTLWSEPGATSPAASAGVSGPQAPGPRVPWTLGGDLEKYRAYAVSEGSRNSGENLKKALERAGMTLGDGVNVFVLGYASDRAKPFRQNDGKGFFQEPGKVPVRAGATLNNFGASLYSLADLITFNALPDPNKPVYKDNHPIVRPVIFAGRTVGGVWKTTEEIGNAVTWGLFDNFTGCVGLVIEDIVEFVKHAGEAVVNVARVPIRMVAGKKKEGVDRAMDWVLLVPLELASNAVEMKGFSNMADYQTAFADKGVIGSVLEFGGSTYLVYRAVDQVLDRQKKHKHTQDQSSNQNQGGSQSQSGNGSPGGNEGQNGGPPSQPPVPDSYTEWSGAVDVSTLPEGATYSVDGGYYYYYSPGY